LDIVIGFVAGYLLGGIPTAYLVARYRLGIDIRRYGTGNVGASNVVTHVGKKIGFALGLFDVFVKGTGPVAAVALLQGSDWAMVVTGLAAIAGHNWSPYIRFSGGRGVNTTGGVFLGFLLFPEFLMIIVVAGFWGGLVRKNSAMWLLLTMLATPVMAVLLSRPYETVIMTVAALILLVAKRLVGNWERPLEGEPLRQVLFYRLLFDRDIASRDEWVFQQPHQSSETTEA